MTKAEIEALGTQTQNNLFYASDTKQFFLIYKGEDGGDAVPFEDPTALASAQEWFRDNGIVYDPAIETFYGGAADSLDGIPAANLTLTETRAVVHNSTGVYFFKAIDDDTGSPPPYSVYPADHESGDLIWQLMKVNAPEFWTYNANGYASRLKSDNLTANRLHQWPDASVTLSGYSTSTAAPASAPAAVGLFHVNTSAKVIYTSVGTASAADWIPFATTLGHAIGWNPDQSKFQKITIRGTAGSEYTEISDL